MGNPHFDSVQRGRGVRFLWFLGLALAALPSVAMAAPGDLSPDSPEVPADSPPTPPAAPANSSAAPAGSPEAPVDPPTAPAGSPTTGNQSPPEQPKSQEEPAWSPDQYFFVEGFLITTRLFPEDPEATAPIEPRGLLRAMWAWAAPLLTTTNGIQLASTSLVEASILQSQGRWEAFDQYRLCFGLAAWNRRVSVWNQFGRCYSPAKDPYGTNGPDPMVGFASVFWAFRTDNPFRHFGWRTDVNVRAGKHQVRFSGMLAVNDAELTQRGSERFVMDRAVGALVWRFPNACRALGLLNYSFYTSTEHYGAVHAACEFKGAWEWGAGGIIGGRHNENGHGLQILNRISRTLPSHQTMEFVGTATMSFLRWAGEAGRLYSLGGEGTWRFANGVGVTAGAFRVWLDRASLAEGARRGQTESEFFMNLSWLYE
jgi:hypothetical protein